MKVSTIITTYCRPQALRRALDSVRRQTYKNVESIVVDDNGNGTALQKETQTVVSQYPNVIYYVNSNNVGQAASLNAGLAKAHGDLVAFLDDDDEYYPEKLAKQVARIKECDAAGVYCNYKRILNNRVYYTSPHKPGSDEGDLARDMLLGQNEICGGSTLLLRHSVLAELGGFDERFKRHVDWSFLVRFFRNYQLALCDDVLVTIHMDDRTWTVNPKLLFETKQLFLSEFEQDIVRHGKAAPDIYFKHWSDVYFQCLRQKEFGLAFRSLCSSVNKGHFNFFKLLRITASALKHAD